MPVEHAAMPGLGTLELCQLWAACQRDVCSSVMARTYVDHLRAIQAIQAPLTLSCYTGCTGSIDPQLLYRLYRLP
jgi:hypothetical protein